MVIIFDGGLMWEYIKARWELDMAFLGDFWWVIIILILIAIPFQIYMYKQDHKRFDKWRKL